jgi:hypothetical protein
MQSQPAVFLALSEKNVTTTREHLGMRAVTYAYAGLKCSARLLGESFCAYAKAAAGARSAPLAVLMRAREWPEGYQSRHRASRHD